MTEVQCFILLWMRGSAGGCVYVGHVSLPEAVEIDPLAKPPDRRSCLRDPRKGEDLRSLTRKLERMVARGWVTCSRETFYTITDAGLAALKTAKALNAVEVMHHRERERQRRWQQENEDDRRQYSLPADESDALGCDPDE